jgi:serine protease Do
LVKSVMDQLIAKGKVVRGYMGIRFRDVDGQIKVFQVLGGSPAEKAGVRVRDAVTELDGKALKDGEDFRFRIAGMEPNSEHKLTVLRDGKTETLKVTLGELPEEEAAMEAPGQEPSASMEKLGLKVSDLTPDTAKEYGFAEGAKGVVITDVRSAATAALGIKPGMLIKTVGETPVKTAADFAAVLDKSNLKEGVELRLEDAKGATMSVLLAPEKAPEGPLDKDNE